MFPSANRCEGTLHGDMLVKAVVYHNADVQCISFFRDAADVTVG